MPESLIFEIGTPNRSYDDLAIPGRWEDYASTFAKGVLFEVGKDDPGQAWPYIQPGPDNFWGGFRRHPFKIRFRLDTVPKAVMSLRIHLVAGHWQDPPTLEVKINDRARKLQVPRGPGDGPLRDPSQGAPIVLPLVFQSSLLREGENRIELTSLVGSWLIYDAIQLLVLDGPPAVKGINVRATPLYVHHQEGPRPLIEVSIEGSPLFEGGELEALAAGEKSVLEIAPDPLGITAVEIPLPAIPETAPIQTSFVLRARGQTFQREAAVDPVRKWIIHLLHHTHLDIGYTHTQEEVRARQVAFIDDALKIAQSTSGFPEGARFRWLPEGLFAVASFLKTASPEKRAAFVRAVGEGSIGLDALYGNALTGICSEEELIALTDCSRTLRRRYGIEIETAMITDVPGCVWGLVPALRQAGVKYLSLGPNRNHRIGHTLSVHGDRPFYWVSPSGRDKILVWMAGEGYSWFHTGLDFAMDFEVLTRKRTRERFLEYLARLEEQGYPYDRVQIRYNIGSDNGPPDPTLPAFVKEWNEKYAFPRMELSTAQEMFQSFEAEYGDALPRLSGDFTPYWEDGAASMARETAKNRAAAQRLVQAAALFALFGRHDYPMEKFEEAWQEVLLYDEHTFGAWNSISEPDAPFVKNQKAWKAERAEEADRLSRALLDDALPRNSRGESASDRIWIGNTASWPRTDLVMLPLEASRMGDRVEDSDGQAVPSQRLASGALAFMAENVPPLGAKCYFLRPGKPLTVGSARIEKNRLFTDTISLTIDLASGAIASFRAKGMEGDFVALDRHKGLCDYVYVEGRDSRNQRFVEGPSIVTVIDDGPLVAGLRIESRAPGCKSLVREVRLVHGLPWADLVVTLDREKIRDPEGLHLAFPLDLPEGTFRIDMPFAPIRPEQDQLAGANKDFFPVQWWVDLSDGARGLTVATPDAPIVEAGEITMDVVGRGNRWKGSIEPEPLIYSYVMNNYWETNYAADQEGAASFRYALLPHGPFDPVVCQRFGRERSRPLVVMPVGEGDPPSSLLVVEPDGVIVTSIKPSLDGEALMVRLFNVTREPRKTRLRFREDAFKRILASSPFEEQGEAFSMPFEMAGLEVLTLRCEKASSGGGR